MNQPNSHRSDLSARDRRRARKAISQANAAMCVKSEVSIIAAALRREREEAHARLISPEAEAALAEYEARRTAGKGRKART